MNRSIAAFAVILAVSSIVTGFDPGCSFVGNQCQYTVKLGHTGQCDTPTTNVPRSNACCTDLTAKYDQFKDDMDELTLKVNAITSALSASDNRGTKMKEELEKAIKSRDDIVAMLGRKESELNSTKADLAKVMAKAASEIQQLREELSSARNSVSSSSCQTNAHSTSNPREVTTASTDVVHPGDYSLTYYNFNSPPAGFTYTRSQYGRVLMSLMKKGSSTSTGPRVEHSWGIQKGSYLGINAHTIGLSTPRGRTNSLTAETGSFPPYRAYCVMFWYFMRGSNVKTLTVSLKIRGGTGYPLFSRAGGSSGISEWKLAVVDLNQEHTADQFKIEFTMTTDAYYQYRSTKRYVYNGQGDIAVDDLYVYNTSCASIPKYPSCSYHNVVSNVTSFYTFHATPMTWTDAYDICRQAGPWSALVSIQSDEEQRFLVDTIKGDRALTSMGQNGFYTSGTDADDEHHFTWTNTGVPATITKPHWHAGQPNNVAGNQDCLLMEYPNNDYEWGDVPCDTKHPFICEMEIQGRI